MAVSISTPIRKEQSILLKNIPAGYTWKVTESEDEWYVLTNSERERTGTFASGVTAQALYENTRIDTALTVKKTVRGNMGDKYKLFDFEVYIVDESRELEGTYTMTITNTDGDTATRQAAFTEGAATMQLRHGDTAVISGLPIGVRYEVDELPASRAGYMYSSTNETGTLTAEGSTTEWTNRKGIAVPTGGLDWKFPGTAFFTGMGVLLAAFLFTWKKKKK